MTQKILVAFILASSLALLSAFAIFGAFHYCKDDKAEKVFLTAAGVLCFFVMVVSVIGIMNT